MFRYMFELEAHLVRQAAFSVKTFGPGQRTQGVLAHIQKELGEVAAKPDDIMEWIDLVILAFDGALRRGFAPEDIVEALRNKQEMNERRKWPDWREASPNAPIEHIRGEEPKEEEENQKNDDLLLPSGEVYWVPDLNEPIHTVRQATDMLFNLVLFPHINPSYSTLPVEGLCSALDDYRKRNPNQILIPQRGDILEWVREMCGKTALVAQCTSDGWRVKDPGGAVWWANEGANDEIAASANQAATALRICVEQPMRGRWES